MDRTIDRKDVKLTKDIDIQMNITINLLESEYGAIYTWIASIIMLRSAHPWQNQLGQEKY